MSVPFTFRYGLSTSVLNIRKNEGILDGVAFAIRNKFEHIEIINDGQFHMVLIDDDEIEQIRELCHRHKISISVHAPFYSIDLASLSERMRRFAIDEIINSLHFAKSIDAKWVTFHLGFKFYPTKVLWKQSFRRLIDSLKKILKITKDLNLAVSMELRSGCFDLGHPILLEKILKAFDYDDFLYVTIDTVQAVGFPKIGMDEIIRKFEKRIISFHVRDTNPSLAKDMLACGEGIIDWEKFVNTILDLNLKVPLIFEVSDKEGALFSREYLENIVYSKLHPEKSSENIDIGETL